MFETLKEWDRDLFIYLNNLGIEQYDRFWIFVTQIESWIFLFVLLIVLILKYYKLKKGAFVSGMAIATVSVTLLVTQLFKEVFARLRPNNNEVLAEFIRILQEPTGFSFFSGHASSSFCISFFVVFALRKYTLWIYLLFIWPVLFTLSRIYVGVHYPSDILVGALVGFLFAVIGYWLCKKGLQKL